MEDEGFGEFRNLRASRMTYFPVKPDAPRMMTSKGGGCIGEVSGLSAMDGREEREAVSIE